MVFVVPGALTTRTGGSIYNRRMVEALRGLGWAIDVREWTSRYPDPTPADVEAAARDLATIADGDVVVIDGLALSTLPGVIEREATRLRIVALVHLPLAAGIGLDPAVVERRFADERRAFHAARAVVVSGAAGLDLLRPYDLDAGRVFVVEPGTMRGWVTPMRSATPVQLLAVATINAGKGHDVLLRALVDCEHTDWRLTCAGSLSRDPATSDHVRHLARVLEIDGQVSFVGDLDSDDLDACYEAADVFVSASLRETYGMAVAEALAHGLPVVATRTGATEALVGPDAGLVVPPGDAAALTSALDRVIGDVALRHRLAEGARRVRDTLPTWDAAAAAMATVLERAGQKR